MKLVSTVFYLYQLLYNNIPLLILVILLQFTVIFIP